MGVSEGWQAYANRAHPDDLDHLDQAHDLARQPSGRDVLYFVYGGGQRVRDLCRVRGWHVMEAGSGTATA
jgi:hypothetical protein